MTHEPHPAPQPHAPASEASIQKLIALERRRAQRERQRRDSRQMATVWIVAAIVVAVIVGGVLYLKVHQQRMHDRSDCEFEKTVNGYSLAEAELACR